MSDFWWQVQQEQEQQQEAKMTPEQNPSTLEPATLPLVGHHRVPAGCSIHLATSEYIFDLVL